jgi:hypothetical protein
VNLFENRFFVNVIKDLTMKIIMNPKSNVGCPYKIRREHREARRGEDVQVETENGVICILAKECQGCLEITRS